MKNYFPVFIYIFFTLVSCNKREAEMNELNSYLLKNSEFNIRFFNAHRAKYFIKSEETYVINNEKLNQLDAKYEILIKKIDRAISSKDANLDEIVSDYQSIVCEIPNIINEKIVYSKDEIKSLEKFKTNSKEFYLNSIKNRLVISMAYAFEYANNQVIMTCGLRELKVDDIILSRTKENRVKLTLTSKQGQRIRDTHILVNNIKLNGKEKKVDYELNENYSFADIEFDTLQKGNYQIKGSLRYYAPSGKIDIPFEKEFKVE